MMTEPENQQPTPTTGPVTRQDGVTIEVDRELCIGAASCSLIAGLTFALDQEQKAIIINPDGNDLDTILQAAQSCPTDAIIIKDKHGAQLWP